MRSALLASLLLAGLIVAKAPAQGRDEAVTEKDVLAMKLNHYFTADRKSHQPDFEWTFTKDEFFLDAASGKIPAGLQEQLLPEDMTATQIRGEWKLAGGKLLLGSIKAHGKDGKKEASLDIYRTAPSVIRIGKALYVFGLIP